MAVYKNYYTRNNRRWSLILVTFNCLFLICISSSVTGGSLINGEQQQQQQQQHHRHHRPTLKRTTTTTTRLIDDDDVYVSQLERSALKIVDIDDDHLQQFQQQPLKQQQQHQQQKRPYLSCPNCLYKTDREMKSEADNLRLEAIKRQILSKLGLKHKPNITHSLPREVIMQTLYRAEDNSDFFRNYNSDDNLDNNNNNNNNSNNNEYISTTSHGGTSTIMETVDVDDFYGRTSEIISFAEQGSRVNQNRLLEFRVNTESEHGAGQEFRVRSATLWLKADIRHRRPLQCRSTEIYVFKIISRLPETVTLSSQDFDRATSDPVAQTLQETNTGWQKLDLTDIVRKWLSEPNKDKLRLFVDCSCCSHWYIHLFNNNNNNNSNNNNNDSDNLIDKNNNNNNPNRPFLVIHTDPNIAKRVRRRALDCSPDSGNQCCKQRFYVSFKKLGWDDWVIAPHGYYANYCRGDCGHHRTPDTYVTYHTHVIEEVRKTQHLSGMQPCCAPLKFSSMSLIYYGPDLTIIKRDLPKMVVDECGCP